MLKIVGTLCLTRANMKTGAMSEEWVANERNEYSQTPRVHGKVIGEYYTSHTRLSRTTLPHKQDLPLLRLFELL